MQSPAWGSCCLLQNSCNLPVPFPRASSRPRALSPCFLCIWDPRPSGARAKEGSKSQVRASLPRDLPTFLDAPLILKAQAPFPLNSASPRYWLFFCPPSFRSLSASLSLSPSASLSRPSQPPQLCLPQPPCLCPSQPPYPSISLSVPAPLGVPVPVSVSPCLSLPPSASLSLSLGLPPRPPLTPPLSPSVCFSLLFSVSVFSSVCLSQSLSASLFLGLSLFFLLSLFKFQSVPLKG